mmetsp:Transcript_46723/g.124067  ORF Transcript_46723/g.124067 Transcript_46723/m.124067 type:complete len:257 (-) Transcript_46723:197-967(-)
MEHNRGQLGNISCQVRQQSRDVATAIKQCSAGLSPESWVVLVEDDTPICPGGARQIATVLASISNTSTPFRFKTAHFSETFRWDDACCTILRHLAMSWMNPIIQRRLWRVLSAKFLLVSSPDVNANAGRSGTAFPVEAVEFFATYLLQNLAARPPDHLVDEHWWSDRRDFIYNGNLFLHNGYVSAFPVRNSGAFHEELDKRRFDSRKVTCIEALPYQVERAIQRPVPRGKKRKPRGVGKQQPAPMTNATKRQAAAS